MAIFQKKNVMQKLEAELAKLQGRAKLLEGKRADSQAALDFATAERQRFMIEGDIEDDKSGAKLQAAVDTLGSTLIGFDIAIAEIRISIDEIEGKLSNVRQAADRRVASEKLAAQVLLVDEMLPAWVQSSSNLASALDVIGVWRFESAQMANFVRRCSGEVQDAAAITSTDLHASVAAIRDGQMPIPRDPEAAAPVPQLEPELVQVFALRAVKWTDQHGLLRRSAKWHDIELPQEVAERALRNNLAAPMSDPRRRQLLGQSPGHPEPHWCIDLDHEPEADEPGNTGDPVTYRAVTPIDGGPGFEMKTSGGVGQ
jgi:hypothetical protein